MQTRKPCRIPRHARSYLETLGQWIRRCRDSGSCGKMLASHQRLVAGTPLRPAGAVPRPTSRGRTVTQVCKSEKAE